LQKLLIGFIALQFIYLGFTSCKKTDERLTTDSKAVLAFDTDSVIFDTVFTGTVSVTRRLKVYNNNPNAVNINSISVGENFPSNFKIIIDGVEGNVQKDVFLRGRDSILVLVKALINPLDKSLPYIIDEDIFFQTNGNTQSVKVVAWGQDAYFHYEDSVTVNTTWPTDKPHIVFDYVKVNKNTTLTLLPGTKVFMHGNSLIYIEGNIKANGTFENPIEFDDDRLEQYRTDVPGYWYGVLFVEGSKDNEMDFCTIKNAQWGVRLGTPDSDTIPDLIIKNSYIYNISTAGIVAYTSDILGINCVITGCAQSAVACLAGGSYTFINCTFALGNYLFSNRKSPTVAFADYILDANDQPTLINDLGIYFYNNIVWGNNSSIQNEFIISDIASGGILKLGIANNLLKTSEKVFDINDNILNIDPDFEKLDGTRSKELNLRLKERSLAIDKGLPINGIDKDIDNKPRSPLVPDIGAYER
jgi:hypothetical protein